MKCRFAVIAAFAVAGLLGLPAIAQAPSRFDSADEARAALDAARQQQRNARARGERLEQRASRSRETAQKARSAAAALAARVQQAEAGINAVNGAIFIEHLVDAIDAALDGRIGTIRQADLDRSLEHLAHLRQGHLARC